MTEVPVAAGRLLRRTEAAEYIRTRWGVPCHHKTLAKLAVVGGGPAFRRFGRIPVYDPHDLDQWVQGKLSAPVRSTAEFTGVPA